MSHRPLTQQPPPHRYRILVVEDYDDAREMVAECLRLAGFVVSEARDGGEAIDAARRLQPDLILMDLGLPRVDGWTATAAIKTHPATARIPIVALTAYSDTASLDRARAAGCALVCCKPCDPADIVVLVGGLLATT